MIYVHDVAILAASRLEPGQIVAARTSAHLLLDEARIHHAHLAVGHRIGDSRLRQRLRNGLQFIRFDVDGIPVATSWLAGARGRYIDELNWLLPMAADECWLRDVFVAQASRGRRLFSDIVTALAMPEHGQARRIWSDVDWVNVQSMRAHEAAGFRVVARVRALDLAGRVRLRSALPPWPLPVTEIDPASRWIWLRGSRLQRHQELLA